MIKVSGQYVSPIEVENTLAQHEAVLEAAVIGVTDSDGLMKTTAYVVLRNGEAGDSGIEHELQAYVKQHLAPFKYPRSIRSEEHTSELQSLMRISYAVFCLKKKTNIFLTNTTNLITRHQQND